MPVGRSATRHLGRLTVALLAVVLGVPITGAASPMAPAPMVSATDEVVALVVEGTGLGHGRGLSQWGAYGWAVNHGWSWQQILDHYYGGTVAGTASTGSRVRVRLVGSDGAGEVAVVSSAGTARWNGTGYASLRAVEVTFGSFDVYGSSQLVCGGSDPSWTLLASGVSGPVTFATSTSETAGAAGEVLGLCQPDGSVVHYRGRLELTKDSGGGARLVNDVAVEDYLRGVVSREVPASWGDAGGGGGLHALRAQAVAARTYALSQDRYAGSGGYATTCDTTACQAYGGAARRPSPTSATTSGGVCEAGNPTFECANTSRAIIETAGQVRRRTNGQLVATEFSASNGPRTAGGTFPAVDDPADDVPSNPNHRWTRVLDAHTVAAYWNLGPLAMASTEPDPATPYEGIWDNRVRLVGDTATQLVGSWDFRGAFGLPSPGFTIRAVTRGMVSGRSFALIGDSVGLSVTETATSELPAMLDGVFTAASYDAVQNRCTAGCALSGVAAAGSVPVGTDEVVVELGYNDSTTNYGARIDEVMRTLTDRGVGSVAWVNLSTRSGRASYVAANQALLDARARWPQLRIIDWATLSGASGDNQGRWFASDGIHLTATGQARFAGFLRDQIVAGIGLPDARDDLLLRYPAAAGWIWDVGRSSGSGFAGTGNWYWGRGGTAEPVYVGDLTGDGRDDVLLRYQAASGWVWDVGRSTGSGFVAAGNWSWGRGGTAEPVYVGDFNGDGRDDVLLRYPTAGGWLYDVGRSTGSGFAPAGNWPWARGATSEPVYVGNFR